MSNSYNTGNVTTGTSYAGGLAGVLSSGSVSNSYNAGHVAGGNGMNGGLVGYNMQSPVTNSYNLGSVSGDSWSGGLLGRTDHSTITGSFSTGAINGTRPAAVCPNPQTLCNGYNGGLIAINDKGSLSNCAWAIIPALDAVGVNGYSGDSTDSLVPLLAGKGWGTDSASASAFLDQSGNNYTHGVYSGWDFANTWEKKTCNYPNLKGVGGPQNADNGTACLAATCNPSSATITAAAGTPADPYLICSCAQLQTIPANATAVYQLTSNIDCASFPAPNRAGFMPIENFRGTFDGNGKVITGLTVASYGMTYNVGLFGSTTNATIKYTGLKNISIIGYQFVGGLIGSATNTDVNNVFTTGTVVASGLFAGGLIGSAKGTTVTNTYSTCTVRGTVFVGGLIGDIEQYYSTNPWNGALIVKNTTITHSYATGNVNGSSLVGGLVGQEAGLIVASYATGNVSGCEYVGSSIGMSLVGSVSYGAGAVARLPYTCFNNGGVIGGRIGLSLAGAAYQVAASDFYGNGSGAGGGVYDVSVSGGWGFGTDWTAIPCNYPNLKGVGGPQNADNGTACMGYTQCWSGSDCNGCPNPISGYGSAEDTYCLPPPSCKGDIVVTGEKGGLGTPLQAPQRPNSAMCDSSGTTYGWNICCTVAGCPAGQIWSGTACATPPGAPTGVSAIVDGNGIMSISFTPPVSDGGSAITSYTPTVTPADGVTVSAGSSPVTVTGLTGGTVYTFTVHATNAAGDGPESAPSDPVTACTTPGAPNIYRATATSSTSVDLAFSPGTTGGCAINSTLSFTNYSDVSCGSTGGTSSPVSCADLTPGGSYYFLIRAANPAGMGTPSQPYSFNMPCESNTEFCSRLGKTCGSVTGTDNCGASRTVASCGTCTAPKTCGGSGTANVCETVCAAETDAALCSRLVKTCGSVVDGTDNCGNSRSVLSCGSCAASQSCNNQQCVSTNTCWSGDTCDNCPNLNGTSDTCYAPESCIASSISVSGTSVAGGVYCDGDSWTICCDLACVPETDAVFCQRLNSSSCTALTALDNCGKSRDVSSCATCQDTEKCCVGQCPQRALPLNGTTALFPPTNLNATYTGACASATCGADGTWGSATGTCCPLNMSWNGSACANSLAPTCTVKYYYTEEDHASSPGCDPRPGTLGAPPANATLVNSVPAGAISFGTFLANLTYSYHKGHCQDSFGYKKQTYYYTENSDGCCNINCNDTNCGQPNICGGTCPNTQKCWSGVRDSCGHCPSGPQSSNCAENGKEQNCKDPGCPNGVNYWDSYWKSAGGYCNGFCNDASLSWRMWCK